MKKITFIALLIFATIIIMLFVIRFIPKNTTTSSLPKQNTKNVNGQNTNNSTTDTTQAFTATEVAKHNTPNDCYLIVKGKVYDVSNFLDHPGGQNAIDSRCGQEATQIFTQIHSNFAWNLLKDYYVGDLVAQ